MNENIGRLILQVPIYTSEITGQAVYTYFENNKEAEGVVVLDGQKPVGIIMRGEFYQKIGKQYGFSLYMNRSVERVMNRNMLIVDAGMDVVDVSIIAMNREQENLYDFVVVVEEEKYIGVVSIKLFLVELSRKREKEIELLKQQQDILKRANEIEKQHGIMMEEKNNELNIKNTSIRNLLDNAGQGFLSFGSDMAISDEFSIECVNIFGEYIGNMNLLELIGKYVDQNTVQTIGTIFDGIFRNSSTLGNKVYISLLPKELIVKEKYLKAEYKIINSGDNKRIMMVLTDITDKKDMEAKMLEEKNNLKLIVRALSNKSDLHMAIEDYRDFFNNQAYCIICNNEGIKEQLQEIFRMVHTFKGDFSQFYFYNTSEKLHGLEDDISNMLSRSETLDNDDILQFLNQIDAEAIMEKDFKIISDIIGENFFAANNHIAVDIDRIIEIEKKICELFAEEQCSEVLTMLKLLRYANLKELLGGYGETLKNLALKLDKSLDDFMVTGDDIYVDKNKYARFTKSLIHIFKNAIDHGIETPDERVAMGKRELGKIGCVIEKIDRDYFSLTISDDGRGIDLLRLKNKALEKGIIDEYRGTMITDRELLDLIYIDQLSTKESANTLSGRGVGLSAVKSEVNHLGGTIFVGTELNMGTEFKIVLPIL
jgi:Chemotaxis protein histidine kinase and related kinases